MRRCAASPPPRLGWASKLIKRIRKKRYRNHRNEFRNEFRIDQKSIKGFEKRGTAITETSSEMSSEVIKNRSKIDQKSMKNWWKKEEFASRKEVRAPLGRLLAPRWLPDLKMTLRLEARATILEANGGRMEPRRRPKCSQNHEKIDRKKMKKTYPIFWGPGGVF